MLVIYCHDSKARFRACSSCRIDYLQFLRQNETLLKNRFVEFLGPALEHLTITDRMTIANTSTEYNALATYFPIDKVTLDYIHRTCKYWM